MNVEIWSDIVCPFCYIGKRRFEKALATFEHRDDVEVVWRSFELDPNAATEPDGSRDLDELLATKYGTSLQQAKAMNARMVRMAAGEGLDFRLSEAKPGNTFDAHRLLHLAGQNGLQEDAKERLLKAYFTEGRPVGDREVLVELAVEVGLDGEQVRSALDSDAYADEVRADERRARQLGIGGVPFFVLDGAYGVSGAQDVEAFVQALGKAWTEANPLAMVSGGSGAGTCDDDGCDVDAGTEVHAEDPAPV